MADGLVSIFATAILPIIAIAAVGFLLGRTKPIDPDPLNTVTVYVLVPALVIHSLVTTTLSGGTLVRVAVGVVAFVAAMAAISEAIGRVADVSEPRLSALVLVATFSNSGNFGIPLSEFAFGTAGRSTAVLYMATQSVLMYTLGVYVASRDSGSGLAQGLKTVFRIPLIYAVIAALLIRALGVAPPADSAVMETLGLVGNASIPLMLLILGVQLAKTDYAAAVSKAGGATALKMGVAPLVAVPIAFALDFESATVARVFVLECAAPAAVTPLILMVEFAGDVRGGGVSVPEYVSTVVLVTTLVSVPVLTGLIALLRAGVFGL